MLDKRRAVLVGNALTWAALKLMYRPVITLSNSQPLPRLLPPLPYYDFNTNYPPTGQETNARELQAARWAGQAHIPYRERMVTA